jgi:predicted amidohydrolase YtcJ
MEPWLITAGRVYDGVAEKALERAYVTIDEDTITAVGPQTELEGHTGHFARVIDLGGRGDRIARIEQHAHPHVL